MIDVVYEDDIDLTNINYNRQRVRFFPKRKMVNRVKFDRALYNPLAQARGKYPCYVHGVDDRRFYKNSSKSCWGCDSYCQKDVRGNRPASDMPRDYKHACSMCPGDFTHSSCKYCLADAEEFASSHYHSRGDDHHHSFYEPRRQYFDSEPLHSMSDDVPISFFRNAHHSGNPFGSFSRENYCEFCFKNGETAVIYKSHQLRNPSGSIACPILKEYVCCSCSVSDEADCGFSDGFIGTMPRHGCEEMNGRKKKFTCLFCTPQGKEFCDSDPPVRNYRCGNCPPARRFSNGFLNPYDYLDMMY